MTGTKISQRQIGQTSNPLILREFGLNISCKKDNVETYFRCILSEEERDNFFVAVRTYVKNYDIDANLTPIGDGTSTSKLQTQSVFRQAMVLAMDRFESRTNKEQILQRRGAFSFLPVYFANDLIHGSW